MKQRLPPDRASATSGITARQAAAQPGTQGAAGQSPRQLAQGERIAHIAQLAGGKQHHDPSKKKHLAKGVGKKQKEESARALAIKKASTTPMSNKEAKRQARGA